MFFLSDATSSLSEHESVIALETSFEALLTDGLSFQLVNHGFGTP
ncbi:hypothetical protein [Enterococcus casseliflavus]|nr:hypothetical protein [Enterococcus casseliflavus]OJG31242.1 hypothetical protein RU99_GL003049 [Enterococcus casseliflavus]